MHSPRGPDEDCHTPRIACCERPNQGVTMTAALADVSVLSDGELASALTEWAGHLAAGEATFVDLVGEFDAREAWAGAGILSCAHWLAWRCSLGANAARERVRVARAVRDLPAIRAEFRAGRLSYSQVRALTRVATPHTEGTLVECARTSTATQLNGSPQECAAPCAPGRPRPPPAPSRSGRSTITTTTTAR